MDALSVKAVLARTPELNSEHLKALASAAGGDLSYALDSAVLAGAALPARARSYLTFPDETQLRADLDWIGASRVQLLACTDPGYPPQLLQTPGSPAVLFVLGSVPALAAQQLAMVGSRSATPGGCATARDFAARFARAGLAITSGLALGIDAASHEGALAGGGVTIAVCGTGLDRIYPPQHVKLAERICANGALVSEFPPRTGPLARNFPRRNRLISGLSLGVLVVEATVRSGSLITARLAGDQGRDVFAIPGSIHSPQSSGCHKLIRQGALLVEAPADVLLELKIPFVDEGLTGRRGGRRRDRALDKGYEMLLDAVGFEPATVDLLVARTGLPGETILSMLLILELEGRIAPYPGGRFGRIPR
jgi:DNA processing protein